MRSAELQWSRRRHAFGELQVFQVRNEHRWQGLLLFHFSPFTFQYHTVNHMTLIGWHCRSCCCPGCVG
jgi:hypothetical protein